MYRSLVIIHIGPTDFCATLFLRECGGIGRRLAKGGLREPHKSRGARHILRGDYTIQNLLNR